MKKTTLLFLFLSLSGTALAGNAGKLAQRDNSLTVFWQKFKTAVINGDQEAITTLSKFPVEMSYGIPSIKNKVQLRRRYREVFNKQTNAAQCFARAKPEIDAEDSKRFTIACPDASGNPVVIYRFEHTRIGWKFVALDNLNE